MKVEIHADVVRCPLCSSDRTSGVRIIQVEPVVALWHQFFKMDIRPEFRGISEFELRRCRRCAVSFFVPEDLAGSGKMYAELAAYGGYYVSRKWEYEVAIGDMHGRERILEVGCGSGNFIELARNEAGLHIEGLELSDHAVREALNRGLEVRRASVENIAVESPSAYDAVCSFQVLEHVEKPGDFLRACCRILKPGGLLVVCVPNQRSYVRHMINPLDMPPHHMTRWTRITFANLPRFFPLKLVRTAYEPLFTYQIPLYMETYTALCKRKGFEFLLIPGLVFRAERLIRNAKFRQFLKGQNVYASYLRKDDSVS